MAYDIGPKIGIEGEAQFRQAITQINTNLKTLATEMNLVSSSYDKNDKSVEALTAKNSVLVKQMDEQKNKVVELAKGLEAAKSKYGENHKVTQEWQQVLNKATADLNVMERELKENTTTLDDFGNEAEQASEKTHKLDGALGKIMGGLGKLGVAAGKAAIAGVAAVGTTAVAAAAGAFKLASDAGKAADELITLSNKTGISTKQLQEMSYASRFIDVDLEVMTGSMAKLTKSMDAARNGTKLSEDSFKKLGIEIKNQDGSLRDSKTVWTETIDALGKVANETDRDALSLQLFGKSAMELNPLIKAGSDELNRLGEEANKVGAVLGDDAIQAAGKFDDMMQTVEASTKGLAATIGVAVIPAVSEVVNSVVGIVPKITEAIKTGDWNSAGQAVTEGINGLLNKITAALPGLSTMAATIIGGLAGSIVAAIPQVIPPMIDATLMLLNTLIKVLVDNGPMLIEAGINAAMALIDGLVQVLPQLIDVSIKLIMTLVNGLVDNLPKIMDAAVDILLALVDGILALLPELIPAAIQMIVALAKGLIDALPKLIEKVPQIVKTIVDVVVENLPLLIDAAIEIIMALTVALIENLPQLIEASIQIIVALAEGIIKNMGTLLAAVPKIFKALIEAFKEIDWAEIGKNIINGIVNGVVNAAKSLANAVVNAAKSAYSAVTGPKGIDAHSPSRLFRDKVGSMIGAGMAEGIVNSTKQVNEAMNGLNKQMIARGTVKMTSDSDFTTRKTGKQISVSSESIDYKRFEAATYVGMSEAIKEMPTPRADLSMDGKKVMQILFPRLIEEMNRLGLKSI